MNQDSDDYQAKATGYLHPQYCDSLSELGTPRLLPASGGWIIERQIPHARHLDAMGCYPLFACQDWSKLSVDLANIGETLVSLAVVTDPFGEYDPDCLHECFPDVALPFKDHFVVDLSRESQTFVHSHHQRNARKALREMLVEKCLNPTELLDEWTGLYGTLIERHAIKGITAFSRASFARQLQVPGLVMLRARHNDSTVGMLLWYEHGDRAYYHLGAYSDRGYELRASFALFSYSIEYFAQRGTRWLNLGAGAGANTDAESGLSRFKQGWSTGTRKAYFCGRVFDHKRYQEILKARDVGATDYFPAYRVGEFA